ncbi:fibronectin type III domain-containing protein, partial [Streptomyces sp. NPDC127574]
MRGVPPTVLRVLVCGALLVLPSCGWGAPSAEQGERLPAAPLGVTAAAGSATSVHVMWNLAAEDPPVAHYTVYRGNTEVDEVAGSEHMVDVTRLEPSTTYLFTVRARNSAGALGPASKRVR